MLPERMGSSRAEGVGVMNFMEVVRARNFCAELERAKRKMVREYLVDVEDHKFVWAGRK